MSDYGYIKRNLDALSEEIELTANRVGARPPKLVAVTKSGSDDELLALCSLGVSAIGENRPGELKRRGELLAKSSLFPELHQIGTLQSNKAKLVCPSAALIHSLASISLAKELDKQGKKLNKTISVLIEINSACEPQKDGVLPSEAEAFLESISGLDGIRPCGLMTMGPALCDPDDLRGYFRLTRKLFDKLNSNFGPDPILSMGMSESFKIAIEEGSTLIRVGRRLFMK